jgi:anaerobic magnesium-protoporphyrin IX monomethyl ester cyclase
MHSQPAPGLLIYPVGVSPTNPYSSLPTLAAFVRAAGYRVELRDLNVEAYDSWLGERAHQWYRGTQSAAPVLPWSRAVERAKSFMRGQFGDFYDPAQYESHRSILDAALVDFGARYENVELTWGGYARRAASLDVGTLESLMSPGADPVVDFLDHAFSGEDLGRYSWIGISVTFDLQLVPALLTALWMRRNGFCGRLVIGGACAQFIKDIFERHSDLFQIVNALIVMEGESALLALAGDENITPRQLPNAIAVDDDGAVRRTGPVRIENFAVMPAPDYDGMPLHLYFAPAPVLISATSRGCYFNRCTFCVPSFGREEGYRGKKPLAVAQDLRGLTELGSRYLFFADDCIPPGYLKRMWTEYGTHDWCWQTEMRFEPSLTFDILVELRRFGCAQLIFGFESANQRVLDKMDKGTRRDVVDRILDDCARAGINVNLQTMIGFPTETIGEALETFRYLRDRREQIASFSMGHFRLLDNTPIAYTPQSYGLSNVRPEGGGSLQRYDAHIGLSSGQAEALSGAFYRQLRNDFPVNYFFLDGPMGAHALMYAERGNLRQIVAPNSARNAASIQPNREQAFPTLEEV